jgi:potassium-dependent mechanosensitive channel
LIDQNKILQTANFFSKNQHMWGQIGQSLPPFAELKEQIGQFIIDESGLLRLTLVEILLIVVVAVAGAYSGLKLFHTLQRQITFYKNLQSTETTRPFKGILIFPLAFSSLLSCCYLLYLTRDLTTTPYGPWLLFSIGLYCMAVFLYYLHSRFQPEEGSPPCFNRLLRYKVLSFFCVLLFFFTHLDLSNFVRLQSFLDLLLSIIISGICLASWFFFLSFGFPQSILRFKKPMRAGVSILAILVMILDLSGYRNFSVFLLIGMLGTFLLFSFLRFMLFCIDEIIGGFFSGKYQWQRDMRIRLGLSPQENLMSIMWVRLIFKGLVWAVAFYFFLQLWGLSDTQRRQITAFLVNGFTFGGINIAPARIFLGFFIFACGWMLVSWIKMRLEKKWLRYAHFSRSAQDTLVTMTGYAGFALVLIIGLSIAGVSFSNLAVIAGALSVGIGFGLQNIVNNFVSGLIILFERPIKRGDWISVGNTEGYVQKISVRSTVIQTFDRADVIVPNSELISNQVTNMMLNDNYGRLIVPIGVAYGSDTDLVHTLLIDIAMANEQVITDGSAPAPHVLFLEFGESSLNFELRCHLANIDERLRVKSAINYEIDRAFRKHNIPIPFPQRDLYIKEFPSAGINRNTE